MRFGSFGNLPQTKPQIGQVLYWPEDAALCFEKIPHNSFLAYGQGRSYGDVCHNSTGVLLETRHLNRFIAFDHGQGILRCEAGITFDEILAFIVPHGWFLPVVPGTQMISLGGAIANDIHGKNHHSHGSFGRYVRCFELMRSSGERLLCSPECNSAYYCATIGGIGLTGLITWVEVALMPIQSAYLSVEKIKFKQLDEFWALSQMAQEKYNYTVAWFDGLAQGKACGRGIFMQANHCQDGVFHSPQRRQTPCFIPSKFLQEWSIRQFNQAYYYKQLKKVEYSRQHYQSFFFPLDHMRNWNKLYGKRGFYQYQCVVPELAMLKELFIMIAQSGQGALLSVLKTMSGMTTPAVLTFPMRGVTLAMDFVNHGEKTLRLLDRLDSWVLVQGGRVYLAKDARMSGKTFRAYYPQYLDFEKYQDGKFTSDLWRRVMRDS